MDYKIRWTERGFATPLIDKLFCKKINEQFGGKLKLIGVSSAPLAESTHKYVQAAMAVNVVNAYGATETCGGSHMLHVNDLAYGTCGVPYSSAKFYLKDWTEGGYSTEDTPNPRGEIVLGKFGLNLSKLRFSSLPFSFFVRWKHDCQWLL